MNYLYNIKYSKFDNSKIKRRRYNHFIAIRQLNSSAEQNNDLFYSVYEADSIAVGWAIAKLQNKRYLQNQQMQLMLLARDTIKDSIFTSSIGNKYKIRYCTDLENRIINRFRLRWDIKDTLHTINNYKQFLRDLIK